MLPGPFLLSVAAFLASAKFSTAQYPGYYGKYIGRLKTLHHSVSGEIFAVDARTLHIRDFTYDGEGPAAFFYAGNSKVPSASGFKINDEKGSPRPLQKYVKKHVTITLPDSKTLHNIKWFSVWCDEFSVNFGDIKIPKNLDYPRPQKIDALNGVHLVSSDPVVVVDAQTLLIPNFSYDGEAPDAKFWVGRGNRPSPQGIRVPDENGKEVPLRRYDRKTIVLTLPGDLTVFDIGHFGVWCEAFTVDFGHIRIPPGLNVPPSLKMLGVAPQSKLNCEVLWDDLAFEVRWAVAGDSVVLQLVSKLEDGEYMSFGLSGDDTRSKMVGGDVVVAWVDKATLKGYADDYFLDAKSQCAGNRGSCPDNKLREDTGSVRLLNAAMVNGYSIVTYQRPLKAQDELDIDILTNGTQPVVWAIGPLNSKNEVSYHSLTNKRDVLLNFGRAPKWNCPLPETDSASASAVATPSSERLSPPSRTEEPTTRNRNRNPSTVPATPAPAPKNDAWEIPAIQCYEPDDGVFYAQMGPTGGKRGYPAITGHVGWGISWYINGLLIPEINVVRGKTYTFVVEGGLDPEIPARYHPFYITDDPIGGYEHKTPEERAAVRIFAGARQNRRGDVYPTGTGRLCNWKPDPNQPPADEFASFGAYQRTLTLECDQGEPGIVQWTPDKNTPDTVYYQCFTHRYLGWKINVLDSCDQTPAGSDLSPVRAPVDEKDLEDGEEEDEEGELQARPSIQLATWVNPNRVVFATKDKFLKQSEQNRIPLTEHKYIPLTDSPQLLFESQHNSQPDFPFSFEPVSTQSVVIDEGNIRNAFVPPPALLRKPTYSTQYNNGGLFSDQVKNTSNGNTVAQVLVGDSYFPRIIPVKENDAIRVEIHYSVDKPKPAGQNIQTPKETSVTSIQENPSVPDTHNVLQKPTALHTSPSQQKNLPQPVAVVTVDPNGKPIIHDTTPMPVTNVSPVSDSKQESEAEASASSSVNVPLDNQQTPVKVQAKVPDRVPVINLRTTPIPQGYGRIPVYPHMAFQRPMQPYGPMTHLNRPVPYRGFNRPPVGMYRPQYATASSNQQNYIIKKPFYRPVPARPMMMPPQFLLPLGKTHIPLQHTASSTKLHHFTQAPSSQPLKLRKVSSTTTSTSTTTPSAISTQAPNLAVSDDATIKPSPPLLSSEVVVLNSDSHTPIAVNTGFNPHSVVVEGGFKPIITNNKVGAQDRSSEDNEAQEIKKKPEAGENKTEEAVIAELVPEVVEVIAIEERKDNPFQGQEPETFEPMFIPSPPDRNAARNASDKKPILAEELTPPVVHLKYRPSLQPHRRNGHPFMVIRPRPGLVTRPLLPTNIVPPFRIPVRGGSPTFRYQQSDSDTEDETPMAAERMDSYLAPGDGSIAPSVVVTYDGKSVTSSVALTPVVIQNIRHPAGTADLVRGTPQFAPFRGEIPPPVPDMISPENIPQLSKENQQQAQTLPAMFKYQNNAFPHPPPIERTQLLLVQQDSEEVSSDSSEIKEIVAISKGNKLKKQITKKAASPSEEDEIMSTVDDRWPFSNAQENEQRTEESLTTTVTPEETTLNEMANESSHKAGEQRERRSAHHEPGHMHYDDQHHSGHEHSSHQQSDGDANHQDSAHNYADDHDLSQHKQSRATSVTVFSFLLLLSPVTAKYL